MTESTTLLVQANPLDDVLLASSIHRDLSLLSALSGSVTAGETNSELSMTSQMGGSLDITTTIDHSSDVAHVSYLVRADGLGRIILHNGGGIIIQ